LFDVAYIVRKRENWVSSAVSPNFEVMHRQTRFFESALRPGVVSGLQRSRDVPVVDHLPPGSTRSAAIQVSKRVRPCSYRTTDRSGERSQRREASARHP